MSMSFSPLFNCDGCGAKSPGVSSSAYSPPPVGWLWGGHTPEGPHACSERCWWHVSNAVKARTGQTLEAISHDSVEVEGEEEAQEEAAPPPPPAPSALVVRTQQSARNGASGTHARVLEAEVVEEEEAEDAAPAKRPVPLGAMGFCPGCGGSMPPHTGRGRPRTVCEGCNPPRNRKR